MGSEQSKLSTGVSAEEPPRSEREYTNPLAARSELEANEKGQQYPGGEPIEHTYRYYLSYCSSHSHPGREILGDESHHQFSAVMMNSSEQYLRRMKAIMTPSECRCGKPLKSRELVGEWPPEDLNKRTILNIFRDSNGELVIEFYPGSEEDTFYIGEIGGTYHAETAAHTSPDIPTGVDDLVDLVTNHPSQLQGVRDTALDGAFEDYQKFVS